MLSDPAERHADIDTFLSFKIYSDVSTELATQSENAAERAAQVGTGDRSGRIRTYNYPQNRMSDHRINLTLYRLNEIMSGGLLDEVVEPLITDHQAKIVEAAGT